jgi:ABC-2 type transport system ATP-binding protein
MNIIETHTLSRRFGKTDAVHDLNLSVPAGSIFALLGPNGAGKTTTIKVLMNLLPPTAGAATVLGIDSRKLGEREFAQIGYVSENQQLPMWMTVRQLLDYCRPFYPTWDRDLERMLLRRFELPEQRKLSQLSRGMLMKASLLSSLAYRPKLLVLDEPFSGLDPLVREEFVKGVLEVSSTGDWTVFVSSHDIDEVERLCDWVGVLHDGRLQFTESTESLLNRFRRVDVTLPGPDALAQLEGAPAAWLELERRNSLVRFVDTRYSSPATEQLIAERFPGSTFVAHPLSLREIFIALAKSKRARAKAAAA